MYDQTKTLITKGNDQSKNIKEVNESHLNVDRQQIFSKLIIDQNPDEEMNLKLHTINNEIKKISKNINIEDDINLLAVPKKKKIVEFIDVDYVDYEHLKREKFMRERIKKITNANKDFPFETMKKHSNIKSKIEDYIKSKKDYKTLPETDINNIPKKNNFKTQHTINNSINYNNTTNNVKFSKLPSIVKDEYSIKIDKNKNFDTIDHSRESCNEKFSNKPFGKCLTLDGNFFLHHKCNNNHNNDNSLKSSILFDSKAFISKESQKLTTSRKSNMHKIPKSEINQAYNTQNIFIPKNGIRSRSSSHDNSVDSKSDSQKYNLNSKNPEVENNIGEKNNINSEEKLNTYRSRDMINEAHNFQQLEKTSASLSVKSFSHSQQDKNNTYHNHNNDSINASKNFFYFEQSSKFQTYNSKGKNTESIGEKVAIRIVDSESDSSLTSSSNEDNIQSHIDNFTNLTDNNLKIQLKNSYNITNNVSKRSKLKHRILAANNQKLDNVASNLNSDFNKIRLESNSNNTLSFNSSVYNNLNSISNFNIQKSLEKSLNYTNNLESSSSLTCKRFHHKEVNQNTMNAENIGKKIIPPLYNHSKFQKAKADNRIKNQNNKTKDSLLSIDNHNNIDNKQKVYKTINTFQDISVTRNQMKHNFIENNNKNYNYNDQKNEEIEDYQMDIYKNNSTSLNNFDHLDRKSLIHLTDMNNNDDKDENDKISLKNGTKNQEHIQSITISSDKNRKGTESNFLLYEKGTNSTSQDLSTKLSVSENKRTESHIENEKFNLSFMNKNKNDNQSESLLKDYFDINFHKDKKSVCKNESLINKIKTKVINTEQNELSPIKKKRVIDFRSLKTKANRDIIPNCENSCDKASKLQKSMNKQLFVKTNLGKTYQNIKNKEFREKIDINFLKNIQIEKEEKGLFVYGKNKKEKAHFFKTKENNNNGKLDNIEKFDDVAVYKVRNILLQKFGISVGIVKKANKISTSDQKMELNHVQVKKYLNLTDDLNKLLIKRVEKFQEEINNINN